MATSAAVCTRRLRGAPSAAMRRGAAAAALRRRSGGVHEQRAAQAKELEALRAARKGE
jgi:hypothetical protein